MYKIQAILITFKFMIFSTCILGISSKKKKKKEGFSSLLHGIMLMVMLCEGRGV